MAAREDDLDCSPDRISCGAKIELLHQDHRLYAVALDYKVDVDGKVKHCNLQVGQTIKCRYFADRDSREASGYNLICGEQLWQGKLTTTGGNEMLTIYRDERLR